MFLSYCLCLTELNPTLKPSVNFLKVKPKNIFTFMTTINEMQLEKKETSLLYYK